MNHDKVIDVIYIQCFDNGLFGLTINTYLNLYGDIIEEYYVFKGNIIYKMMYILE